MPKIPLNRESIQKKLSYIEDSVQSLGRFKGIAFERFHMDSDNFRITFYDLHRALEAVMDIGSHDLRDFSVFCKYINKLLENPKKFKMEVE